MEDIISKESEAIAKKKPGKKLIVIGLLLGILLAFYAATFLLKTTVTQNNKTKKTEEENKSVQEGVLSPKKTSRYKIESSFGNSPLSFLYTGGENSLFTPLTAYYLTPDNKLFKNSFGVNSVNSNGKPWCFKEGRYSFSSSQDNKVVFCLEHKSDKDIILRKTDLKGNEYKEYEFTEDKNLFTDSILSRVISSQDGDSALIYSPAGAFVFEPIAERLFKKNLPSDHEIINVVHIGSSESALITADNKIYRLNFSNHQGGVFNVDFASVDRSKLNEALKTARLSKDSRKIVFTVSVKISDLPSDNVPPNFQSVIAYNIDLNSTKLSDELDYEERFRLSCQNLLGNKYCLYKSFIEEDKVRYEKLYIKDFESSLKEIIKVRTVLNEGHKIETYLPSQNPNFLFVKAPYFYGTDKFNNEFFFVIYVYNTGSGKLWPLSY